MGEKIIKGHIVEKRYNPAKPDGQHAQLGRADDEFQLLLEPHGGEQIWLNVSEDQYNAVQPGQTFHYAHPRRGWFWFRGLHDSPATYNPTVGAGQGWVAANLRF